MFKKLEFNEEVLNLINWLYFLKAITEANLICLSTLLCTFVKGYFFVLMQSKHILMHTKVCNPAEGHCSRVPTSSVQKKKHFAVFCWLSWLMKSIVFNFYAINENTNYAFVIVLTKSFLSNISIYFFCILQVNCEIQILTKWLSTDRVGQLLIELHWNDVCLSQRY